MSVTTFETKLRPLLSLSVNHLELRTNIGHPRELPFLQISATGEFFFRWFGIELVVLSSMMGILFANRMFGIPTRGRRSVGYLRLA